MIVAKDAHDHGHVNGAHDRDGVNDHVCDGENVYACVDDS